MFEAYSTPLHQYTKVERAIESAATAYRHQIGDLVQLVTHSPAGEVVGRYHGAFGAVYVVRSTEDSSVYAVKSPRADLVHGQSVMEAFANEATMWRRLPDHPFILPARRVFTYDRSPYVQMPYVPSVTRSGASLEAVLSDLPRNTALSAGAVTLVVGQLLTALAFLEDSDEGFVHGDIKPSNLLVRVAGGKLMTEADARDITIAVSDFGLARAFAGQSAGIVGDRYYLPPEFLRPGADLFPKTQDVYAFGCTAIELLLNIRWQSPDEGGEHWISLADQGLTLTTLADVRPDLGPALTEIIWRCLARNPEDRWSTFHQLAAAWQEAVRPGAVFVEYGTPAWDSGEDDHRVSNGAYQYLIRSGHSIEVAEKACAQLWDASQRRAVGDFAQAATLVAEIRAQFPGLAGPVAATGHGLLGEGRFTEAVEAYLEAVRLYEADDEQCRLDGFGYGAACSTLAQVLATNGDPRHQSVAVDFGRKAVRTLPSSGRAHLGLGLALMASGDFEASVDTLEAAARLDTGHRLVTSALVVARALATGSMLDLGSLLHLDPSHRVEARGLLERMSPAYREINSLVAAGGFDAASTVIDDLVAECRNRGDRAGEAQGLNNLGSTLEKAGRLDESLAAFQRAAELFSEIGRPNSCAYMLNCVGRVYQGMERHQDAVVTYERASGVFTRTGNKRAMAETSQLLCTALMGADRLTEASVACRGALDVWRDLGDRQREAAALSTLGEIWMRTGDDEQALVPLREALDLWRALGDPSGEGQTLASLVAALTELSRFEEAVEVSEHAMAVIDHDGRARTLNNRGLALAGLRRFDEAVEAHQAAADLRAEVGDRHKQARALNNMGVALVSAGRITEAIDVIQRAIMNHAELDTSTEEGDAFLNLGFAFAKASRHEEAAATFERAAGILSVHGALPKQASALHNRGSALSELGRFAEAITAYQAAAETHARAGNRIGQGRALNNLGLLYGKVGRIDDAVQALRADVDICREEGDLAGATTTLTNLANVLEKADRLDEAIATWRTALAAWPVRADQAGRGQTLVDLSAALSKLERHEEAVVSWREAADVFAACGDEKGRCVSLVNLGGALMSLDRREEAVAALGQSVEVADRLEDPGYEGQARLSFGAALFVVGRATEAKQQWTEARAISMAAEDQDAVAQLDAMLAAVDPQ